MDAAFTFEPRNLTIDGIEYVSLSLPGYKILVQTNDRALPANHDLVLTPGAPLRVKLLNFQGSAERRAVEKMAAKL